MRTILFTRRIARGVSAVALGMAVSACNLENQAAPAISGPSEFGLSLGLAASPDTVPRDGSSMSVVTLTARDTAGRPVAGQRVALRLSPSYGGTLSLSDVVTGSDGRASVEFTAPVGATGLTSVSILATPSGENFASVVPRSMIIGLVGPEGPLPVTMGVLEPQITYSPTDPRPGTKILFDALSSRTSDGVGIVEYSWDYGDGNNGSGAVVSHAYQLPYTYTVRLTVRDNYGRIATTTQEVAIAPVDEQ